MSLKFASAIIVGRRRFVDVETDGDDEGMRGADTSHSACLQVSNWTDPCIRDIPGDFSSQATLTEIIPNIVHY